MTPADSRTRVVSAARAADQSEKLAAPLHVTTRKRSAELNTIRRLVVGNGAQEERILRALKSGGLTTREAVRDLDVIDLQARLTALRRRGVNVIRTGWVRERSEAGELHTFGIYAVVEEAGS